MLQLFVRTVIYCNYVHNYTNVKYSKKKSQGSLKLTSYNASIRFLFLIKMCIFKTMGLLTFLKKWSNYLLFTNTGSKIIPVYMFGEHKLCRVRRCIRLMFPFVLSADRLPPCGRLFCYQFVQWLVAYIGGVETQNWPLCSGSSLAVSESR